MPSHLAFRRTCNESSAFTRVTLMCNNADILNCFSDSTEKIQLLGNNKAENGQNNGCSCPIAKKAAAQIPPPVVKKEMSIQTDSNANLEEATRKIVKEESKLDVSTQTKSQWLQISLNSPPLSLTQEVPDVVL